VQKFTPCKQIKHTVYKCVWAGEGFPVYIEKIQNAHSMFELKVPLEERIPTIESNIDPALVKGTDNFNVPTQIIDNILRSIKQIREHILSVSNVELLAGHFYFKIDRKKNFLMLFLATNLEIEEEKMHPPLLGLKFNLKLKGVFRVRKSEEKSSSIEGKGSSELTLPDIEVIGKKLPRYEQPACFKEALESQSNVVTFKKKEEIPKCVFCEGEMVESDVELAYEATVNQVLKMHNFIKTCKTKLDPSIAFSCFRYALVELVKDSQMPVLFKRAFPKMNPRSFEMKKKDPAFIY
jgi:hypothetical protein